MSEQCSEQEADPLSMAHFRKLLKAATERVWHRRHAKAFKQIIGDFSRYELQARNESTALRSGRVPMHAGRRRRRG